MLFTRDPATSALYTLSLHDALPILFMFANGPSPNGSERPSRRNASATLRVKAKEARPRPAALRSEEHTSELQSRGQLVCRLPLEKKKRYANYRHFQH